MDGEKVTRRAALTSGGTVVLGAVGVTGCRPSRPEPPTDPGAVPMDDTPETLTARVVSWGIDFNPPAEREWVARVAAEVADSAAGGVDVLLFPELFAAGLSPYTPVGEPEAVFVTRRVNDAVLPAVGRAANPGMLVALGTYWHQE